MTLKSIAQLEHEAYHKGYHDGYEAALGIKEHPANVTQHSNGAEPAEICGWCNGNGLKWPGNLSKPCPDCGGTGRKLRHC